MMSLIHLYPLAVLLFVAALLDESSAFPVRSIGANTVRQQDSRLFGVLDLPDRPEPEDEDEDDEDDYGAASLDEVDRLRKKLSSLISSSDQVPNDDIELPPLPLDEWRQQLQSPPPLTSIGRERATTEIVLLKSLAESDDAITELWNLWFNSRGPAAAETLTHIEGLVITGEIREAESMLRELIDREGIYWVEPVNRLATLLFVDGRLQESMELCEIVLELKPWHFGAISGMVQLCRGLKDEKRMWEFARMGMPSLETNGNDSNTGLEGALESVGVPTRRAWVENMVKKAEARLQQKEQSLESSFQSLGPVSTGGGATFFDDADAWQ